MHTSPRRSVLRRAPFSESMLFPRQSGSSRCKTVWDGSVTGAWKKGRVIAGPAGNPPTIDVPIRVAVVQSGVQEKTIATKVYRTTVSMEEGSSVPFSLVAEDLVYPVPPGVTGDSYVFYIGFDPQALKPEPKAPTRRKK